MRTFSNRYNEITCKRWYDILYLALITAFASCTRHAFYPTIESPLLTSNRSLAQFALLVAIYILINELTHRHRQAFITAAIVGSMPCIALMIGFTTLQMWSYSLLVGSAYFFIHAMKRYGAQWKSMMLCAVTFSAAIIIGGIWPAFHFFLPFLVLSIIITRPIMSYKKYSVLVAIITTAVLTIAPFATHPADLMPHIQASFKQWNEFDTSFPLQNNQMSWSYIAPMVFHNSIWWVIGIVANIYALRSQRIHGDLAALIGVWWLLLGIVVVWLRPGFSHSIMLTLLIPFSFGIGAYFNLLSLPKKLVKRDRRIYRISLGATPLLALAIAVVMYMMHEVSDAAFIPAVVISILVLLFIGFVLCKKYRKQKLSIHLTETGLIIASLLQVLAVAIANTHSL